LSRGPAQVQGEFLRGDIGAGGFDLRTDVEMMRKGGFLRSDKRWTDSMALTGALDSTLDKAAADVRTTIEKYGSALALPVEKLAEVTAGINVKLGGSAEDMQKALGDALTQYADALGAQFSDVIAPLKQWGESTIQTMERVSLALTTVNEVMKSLGMELLESSSASVVAAAGAAAELANKFGGLQNLTSLTSAYYESFYDDAERAARSTQLVTDALAEVGVALPQSRAAFRELVTGLDLTTESGQKQFVVLMNVAGAFAELNPLAEEAASNVKALADAMDKYLRKVLSPEQTRVFEAERLSERLGGVGVALPATDLLALSRQQILDFAKSFVTIESNSEEARIAVLEVAGALFDLRKAADLAALETQIGEVEKDIKALTDVFGDLANLDPVKTITEQFAEGVAELARLEDGLDTILGTVAKTIQETLADMIASQRSLQQFRGGLAGAIDDALLGMMSPSARVTALRATEASLFAQLGSAADPVAVAERLQKVILDRVQAEVEIREDGESEIAKLAKQARDDQIDVLRSQINAFERLRDLAEDIQQLTQSLLFSDISPLNPEQQLISAQTLFQDTVEAARRGDEVAQQNLTGNAKEFLDEARSFYASSEQYANIFRDVLNTLDEIGAQGANVDPQIIALESQLEELQKLNDAQEEVVDTTADVYEAFIQLDNALAQREDENKKAIDEQIALARWQIDGQIAANEKLDAQIRQAAATYEGLIAKLDELNANLDTLAENADLVGARP
jgi:hypothetical protein